MNNKLIISDYFKGKLLGFLFENDSLIRIKNLKNDSLVGNIYCGYVKDVVKNINACFITIENDQKGYMVIKENETIKQGSKILVQVISDKIKTKDYAVTSELTFNGKYVVLTEGNKNFSISKKITDNEKRNQLKSVFDKYNNDEFGLILRTSCINASIDEICDEINELISKRQNIYNKFEHATPKQCLYNANSISNTIEDLVNKYNCQIFTEDSSIYNLLKEDFDVYFNDKEKINLTNKYSLDKHLKQSLDKFVWLKSGAYLIIEQTEALTVIDVNSGKAEINSNRNNTFKKINKEAAIEALRQIQIRNLSGIIIIDFINMNNQQDYFELKQILKERALYDYSKCNIIDFTKLGLLEISRKKSEKPLYQILIED